MYRFAWVLDDFDDLVGLLWQALPLMHLAVWLASLLVFSFVTAIMGISGLVLSSAAASLIFALLLHMQPSAYTAATAD